MDPMPVVKMRPVLPIDASAANRDKIPSAAKPVVKISPEFQTTADTSFDRMPALSSPAVSMKPLLMITAAGPRELMP